MKQITITSKHQIKIVRTTEGRLNHYRVWVLRPRGKALRHPAVFGNYKAAYLLAGRVGFKGKITASLWEQP
jgi:hypothetical protein